MLFFKGYHTTRLSYRQKVFFFEEKQPKANDGDQFNVKHIL